MNTKVSEAIDDMLSDLDALKDQETASEETAVSDRSRSHVVVIDAESPNAAESLGERDQVVVSVIVSDIDVGKVPRSRVRTESNASVETNESLNERDHVVVAVNASENEELSLKFLKY